MGIVRTAKMQKLLQGILEFGKMIIYGSTKKVW